MNASKKSVAVPPPPVKKARGFLTFTLHSHLPYVVNHGTWPHGMEWLLEAAAETYLPLLRVFKRLREDGLALKCNINFTPILMEQLRHPVFVREFPMYCQRKVDAAKLDEAYFAQTGEPNFAETARYWQAFYQQDLDDFNAMGGDIVSGFVKHHDLGDIELITCGATHGYFPLLGTDESIYAQVQTAKRAHKRHTGNYPKGIWVPECGYRPAGMWQQPMNDAGTDAAPPPFDRRGVEEFLGEAGIEFFHVDTALIEKAKHFTPSASVLRRRYSPYELLHRTADLGEASDPASLDAIMQSAAVAADQANAQAAEREAKEEELANVQASFHYRMYYQPYLADGPRAQDGPTHTSAAFPRDPRTGIQVWSGDAGYPGDANYLDFHKKRFPGGHRYWQVTGSKIDMAFKTPYYPHEAAARTRAHAEHYVSLVYDALREGFNDEKPPILCSPFDAELFGHWWYEGPLFLEEIVRVLAESGDDFPVKLINGSAYLAEYGAAGYLALPEGSWGQHSSNYVWMNDETSWTWPYIYRAEHIVRELATEALWQEGSPQKRDSNRHHMEAVHAALATAPLEAAMEEELKPVLDAEAQKAYDQAQAAARRATPTAPSPHVAAIVAEHPVAKEHSSGPALGYRIMQQLCRELLLMESSDWQFLITTQAAKDYAEERFVTHTDQFNAVHAIWKQWAKDGSVTDPQYQQLTAIEERDSVFADIDPSLWARRRDS